MHLGSYMESDIGHVLRLAENKRKLVARLKQKYHRKKFI